MYHSETFFFFSFTPKLYICNPPSLDSLLVGHRLLPALRTPAFGTNQITANGIRCVLQGRKVGFVAEILLWPERCVGRHVLCNSRFICSISQSWLFSVLCPGALGFGTTWHLTQESVSISIMINPLVVSIRSPVLNMGILWFHRCQVTVANQIKTCLESHPPVLQEGMKQSGELFLLDGLHSTSNTIMAVQSQMGDWTNR